MGKEILRSTANDLWPNIPCTKKTLADRAWPELFNEGREDETNQRTLAPLQGKTHPSRNLVGPPLFLSMGDPNNN